MRNLSLSTEYVQLDEQHETGSAIVSIDTAGQPNFTITESVAWDFLEWSAGWEDLATRADVVCFGSLAQRSRTSRTTIECFLRTASKNALRICDVNLRQSFYSCDVLRQSFQHADIVKLNDEELPVVSSLLDLGSGSDDVLSKRLLEQCELRLVCITRGARGSLLVSKEGMIEHCGFRVKVADAVGAGDAFTACLANHYVRGHALEEISQSANCFASWVATQTGATPAITSSELQKIFRREALQ